jgi:hypothetical protein
VGRYGQGHGVDHILTTAYSKEENGIVERANQEILRHLRNIIFDKNVLSKWSKCTYHLYNEFAIRQSIGALT